MDRENNSIVFKTSRDRDVRKLKSIKSVVENYYSIDDIGVKYRGRELVRAREHYVKLARNSTTCSLAMVAKEINRDHSSVIHIERNFDTFFKIEPSYRNDFLNLSSILDDFFKSMYNQELDDVIRAERIEYLTKRLESMNKELDFLKKNT